MNENGIVTRNKAMLVGKGYNQYKGIDYKETCTLAAYLEVIQLIWEFTCCLDFKLYQLDVNPPFTSEFLKRKFSSIMHLICHKWIIY